MALAVAAGCEVTAHHVHHGLRPDADDDARTAGLLTVALGVDHVEHRVDVAPGPNQEARARAARFDVLPEGVMTGHTADDQAETVLLRLLRGAGGDGLSAMTPGPRHPILALRRSETAAVCRELGLTVASDASNLDPQHRRNRVRHELMPLLDDIAERDVARLLVRTADLLRDDGAVLDQLAADVDPTDARAVVAAPRAIARRALRRWLTVDGYPPDAAAIERVLEVASGRRDACELAGGRRVERSRQRLRVVAPAR